MSAELTSLARALGIFMLGFVSIGPNILSIIGTSMHRGRQSGVALALGVATGSGLWATATVAGLTALISAYAGAVLVLKAFGALYLIWLAFKAFRSAATSTEHLSINATRGENLYLRGLAIQLTNPKAALHWIAIVGIGLGPDAPIWVGITLIVSATVVSAVGHLAYAITFSTRPVVAFYKRARRWIEGALGVFFSVAAYKIATYKA